MLSPAAILRLLLIDDSLVTTPSGELPWPIYVNSMPDGDLIQHDSIAIYDVNSNKDGRLMIGTVIQHYGVRLSVRCETYTDGWQKLDYISSVLNLNTNEDVESDGITYRIHNATRTAPIEPLGNEDGTKRRFVFEASFLLTISQIT